MSSTSNLLTVADLEAMPDDGNRYELIGGELYVSTAPSFFHQSVLTTIIGAFLRYLENNPMGRIVPGVGLVFDDYNGVIPDLVFLTHERRRRILTAGRLRAAPEIVIEILSPGRSNEERDRYAKRALYSECGVDEYWIADSENRSVEIYRRDASGKFGPAEILWSGDVVTSEILPGFELPVETIFAD